jgi:hypothetical protein
MSNKEIFDVGEFNAALCCALEYKRLTGQQDLLGESMMTFVAAEYLIAHGWSVETEVDSRKIKSGIGYFGYDLAGFKVDLFQIFEFKFLKKNGPTIQRLRDDVVKLAYVPFGRPSSAETEKLSGSSCIGRHLVVAYIVGLKSPFLEEFTDIQSVNFSCGSAGSGALVPSSGLLKRIEHEFDSKLPKSTSIKCHKATFGQIQLHTISLTG